MPNRNLPALTGGSIMTVMNGGDVNNPVMQILGSKAMPSGTGDSERYRLLVSDGKHVNSFAILATQLNDKVPSLTEFTIVKINRCITSMVNNSGKGNKRVMIILDLTVLVAGSDVGERIGHPEQYTDESSAAAQKPPPAVPTHNPQQSAAPMEARSNGISNGVPPMSRQPAGQADYSHNRPPVTAMSPGNGEMSATSVIASLNPYQNRWTIKARCSAKTGMKTWSNARGEGKLFSMDLLDESGEIRCTAFKETADKFFDMIQVGNVYFVSNCNIKPANKQFTHIKHDYELTLNNFSIVAPCSETSSVPSIKYDFVTIEKVGGLPDKQIFDVIGICKQQGEVMSFTSKAGKDFVKRDITLVDETNTAVTITLWSEQAQEFDGSAQPVVAIKSASIREFNGGKTASAGGNAQIMLNPDIPEAHKLRGWFENIGSKQEFTSISTAGGGRGDMSMNDKWLCLQELKDLQLESQSAEYCLVKATIITNKHENCLYKACPRETPICNKKLIDCQNGLYRCEKCNIEYENFKYRLLTRVNLGDHTTNFFASGFQEQSEEILGMPAQQLGELECSDPSAYQEVFTAATFQTLIFKLRVKMETYNDTNSMKAVIIAVKKPLDFKLYNARLISEIKRLNHIN